MPERVAQYAAAAFLPSLGYPAGLGSGETRKALDRLRFYLRGDVDVDGSTLYRLFHEGLADQLRAGVGEGAAAVTSPGPAARIWQHLYAMIPAGSDGSRQWQHADPYLLRHAAQHAAGAGRLEDLLQDTGFLTSADSANLASLLAALPAGAADGAADTYRASYASHSRQPPAARAQILAVDAARYGNLDLAQRLSSAAIWQPVWASGQSRSARLRLTMTGHTGEVRAVAVGRAGDRDVIVSGGGDGTVRVWDAATGQPGDPAADRPHRLGERGGGGPERGPRRHRLRRQLRDGAGLGRGDRAAGHPAADRRCRHGACGGGGPGRGPRRHRLRRRRREGAGLGRGDRAAVQPAADRPHRHGVRGGGGRRRVRGPNTVGGFCRFDQDKAW